MLNRIQIKPNPFHNEHFWVCFMFTIFCIIFWTVSLSGFFMVLQIVCFYVSSLYIHLIQKNLTYFLPKKLCTRSRRTLFHCSWQYLLNTCLHSNKLMTGYHWNIFILCFQFALGPSTYSILSNSSAKVTSWKNSRIHSAEVCSKKKMNIKGIEAWI